MTKLDFPYSWYAKQRLATEPVNFSDYLRRRHAASGREGWEFTGPLDSPTVEDGLEWLYKLLGVLFSVWFATKKASSIFRTSSSPQTGRRF
jgi:hypothetical protein